MAGSKVLAEPGRTLPNHRRFVKHGRTGRHVTQEAFPIQSGHVEGDLARGFNDVEKV